MFQNINVVVTNPEYCEITSENHKFVSWHFQPKVILLVLLSSLDSSCCCFFNF